MCQTVRLQACEALCSLSAIRFIAATRSEQCLRIFTLNTSLARWSHYLFFLLR